MLCYVTGGAGGHAKRVFDPLSSVHSSDGVPSPTDPAAAGSPDENNDDDAIGDDDIFARDSSAMEDTSPGADEEGGEGGPPKANVDVFRRQVGDPEPGGDDRVEVEWFGEEDELADRRHSAIRTDMGMIAHPPASGGNGETGGGGSGSRGRRDHQVGASGEHAQTEEEEEWVARRSGDERGERTLLERGWESERSPAVEGATSDKPEGSGVVNFAFSPSSSSASASEQTSPEAERSRGQGESDSEKEYPAQIPALATKTHLHVASTFKGFGMNPPPVQTSSEGNLSHLMNKSGNYGMENWNPNDSSTASSSSFTPELDRSFNATGESVYSGTSAASEMDSSYNHSNNPGDSIDDFLEMASPHDLLFPHTDSPLELSAAPSGQGSGQGSGAPSYPVTPPNSYVSGGGVRHKEVSVFFYTQLLSFLLFFPFI
jgi:hypothetical protein